MGMLCLELAGTVYRADATRCRDISLPLQFAATGVQAFGAPPAQAETLRSGAFVGDVRLGGSCNCQRYQFTPHCHGTHTESVGHLTDDAAPVNALVTQGLLLAQLVSVFPALHGADQVVTRQALQAALGAVTTPATAIVVRTLPNSLDKLTRNYDLRQPAYFEPAALAWLAQRDIEHLLVDLPSVDRMDDAALLAHRAFWGLPTGAVHTTQAARPLATITELIHVPDDMVDGGYLLSLQLAPFATDATPSRPLLYPLS